MQTILIHFVYIHYYTWLHNVTYIWHILTYLNDLAFNIEQSWHRMTLATSTNSQELTYCGMSISDVFTKDCTPAGPSIQKMSRLTKTSTRFQDIGIGGVLSLLWFRRQLPDGISEHLLKDIERPHRPRILTNHWDHERNALMVSGNTSMAFIDIHFE